jgi:hypothetical protein
MLTFKKKKQEICKDELSRDTEINTPNKGKFEKKEVDKTITKTVKNKKKHI